MIRQNESETFPASATRILIGSDNARLLAPVQRALLEAGMRADVACTYDQIEFLWKRHRHEIVLVEVSSAHSGEQAVSFAVQIKRCGARQFVG